MRRRTYMVLRSKPPDPSTQRVSERPVASSSPPSSFLASLNDPMVVGVSFSSMVMFSPRSCQDALDVNIGILLTPPTPARRPNIGMLAYSLTHSPINAICGAAVLMSHKSPSSIGSRSCLARCGPILHPLALRPTLAFGFSAVAPPPALSTDMVGSSVEDGFALRIRW